MRIIRIASCKGCPFWSEYDERITVAGFNCCLKVKDERNLNPEMLDSIPEWCPLEDESEGVK